VVSVRADGPFTLGSRAVVTRRVGRMERAMTSEIAELSPPNAWAIRGIDGPVRGNVKGTVEPLADGQRSRVTISLDLEGHGIGKILLPLIVRRQAEAQMPGNMQRLKEQLESGGP
jgi:hypothetical protein